MKTIAFALFIFLSCVSTGFAEDSQVVLSTGTYVSTLETVEDCGDNKRHIYVSVSVAEMDIIIAALSLAIKHLEPSTTRESVYISQADQLRIQANEIEQQERDVAFIKAVLEDLQ
jgi:hypothetical protein